MTAARQLQLPVFAVDGWSGNTVDDLGVEWWVTQEQGWSGSPALRLTLADRPMRDGSFDAVSYRGARVITLEGVAVAPDDNAKAVAMDRLAALLADGTGLRPMTVTEGRLTRRALVRLSAEVRITHRTRFAFDWSVQLTAPDPVRYSADERTLTTAPPRSGDGLTFPLAFPLTGLGEPAGGGLAPVNAGTVATTPVWEITGPCVNPAVVNLATGAQLAFSLTLAPAERLTVDTDARTVTLPGNISRRSALLPGSQWFGLPPGPTPVVFRTWTSGEDARLAVRWRDAWL